jgi:hypothetical protein
MNFTILFEKLYKPIIWTLKEFGVMFLNIENWWTSKTRYTKLNVRWLIFTCLLFTFGVLKEIKNTNDATLNYNRSTASINLLQKKVDALEQKYLSKLESDIKELKDIRSIAKENQKDLKEITDEK